MAELDTNSKYGSEMRELTLRNGNQHYLYDNQLMFSQNFTESDTGRAEDATPMTLYSNWILKRDSNLFEDVSLETEHSHSTFFCEAMHLPKFDRWFDILQTDNEEEYETFLAPLSPVERKRCVQGLFVYNSMLWQKEVRCGYRSSFVLAAAFGSAKCASRMIDEGVDPLIRDPTNNDNWVQAVIEVASIIRQKEPAFANVYRTLMAKFKTSTRKKLLEMEDCNGFRPLELAAKRGVYRLVRAILDTKGVYVDVVGRQGVNVFLRYNLREYQVPGKRERYMRSPLRLVNRVKNSELESLQESGFLTMAVVAQWMKSKFRPSLFWVVLWTISRFMLLFILFYFDPTKSGKRNETATKGNVTHVFHRSDLIEHNVYTKLLIGIAIIGGILGAADIISMLIQLCDPLRRKVLGIDILCLGDYVAKTAFYRIFQFALSVLSLLTFLSKEIAVLSEHTLLLRCLILPAIIFSAFYLLEIVPYIGFFSIALQYMTVIMFKFMILISFLNTLFALFFHDIMYNKPNSLFKNLGESHYSIFLLMQSEFSFGSDPPFAIQLAHIFFYYMTVVLLINFLIAVLSDAVSILTSAKKEIIFLRKLDIVITVEDRIHWWLHRLHCCKRCREKDEWLVCVTDASTLI